MMFPAAAVLIALAAPPAPAPAEAFQQAEKLFARDRFGEAEPLFRAALATDDRFLKRRAYNRLMGLYLRSGRPDKAVRAADSCRAWLKEIGETDFAMLELIVGQCRFELGYADLAERHLAAALDAKTLPPEARLEALRLRADVAAQRRDPAEKDRLAELEKAARAVLDDAERRNDADDRLAAGRFAAEAASRRGDLDAALAILAEFPALHDRLDDPLGRRDTQRQRAKLLAAKGQFAEAAKLFTESLELHRKYAAGRRLVAGDILAEWSAAARAAGRQAEAAKLRDGAAAEYRAAIASAPGDPDAGGQLAAFVRLQSLTRSARQFPEALQVAVAAGKRWSGDPLVDARLKSDRGGLELLTSAYPDARKLLAAALVELDATDPPNLRALPKLLVNLATAELACETAEKADSHLARCRELYRKHRLPADAVRVECDYVAGVASARRGDFGRAMAHFRDGLALCGVVGAAADPVRFNLALNVALIHKEQGDAAEAEKWLKQAGAVFATFPEPDEVGAALIDAVRADLLVTQGEVDAALALAPKIEAACEKAGQRDGYLWATAKHVRALHALAREKDVQAAEAAWAQLAEVQRKGGHLLYARTLNFLGVCAELQGRTADATKHFEEARAFQDARPHSPPVTRAVTLWRLAVLTDKAGKKPEAKKLLEELFDVADRARIGTFGEAAQRAQFFAQFAPAFEQLASWYARDGDGDGLLRVIVRSRSRTLLDQMLAAGVDPRDHLTGEAKVALLKREADARQAVARLRAQAMQIPADGANEPAAKKVLAEFEAAQKEFTTAWREIASADPLTRVLTDPDFAEKSLAQVREAAHDSGGVLLTYMLGRDESFAVLSTHPSSPPQVFRLALPRPVAQDIGDPPPGDLVAGAGFRGVVIKSRAKQPVRPAAQKVEAVPLTDAVAGRLVAQYLRYVADPEFNPTRGINIVSRSPGVSRPSGPEVLGDAVLPPALLDKIRAANAKRLVVVPDGALHKLPFECLLLSASPHPRYALDELPPVCYGPSIAALAVVLNRPRAIDGKASLLTVGDPAYPEVPAGTRTTVAVLPRLPYTAVESKKVRQFFAAGDTVALEGADATEAKVVAALPGKRFVHLAAHGFADEAFGNAFAAVALTPPPRGGEESGNDGFLTLHEISRLRLTGCELTVLSACVTNVGPQRPMEAGVTLAGAFLGAGSRGVMASCWSVDDRATAELMAAFFGAVRPAAGKGVPHPEAMKRARLAVKSKPGWEAPFYWAPFVYLGPPD